MSRIQSPVRVPVYLRFIAKQFLICTSYFLAFAAHAQQKDLSIPVRAFGALTGPVQSFGINSRSALAAASKRIDQQGGVRLADGSIGHFAISYADDHCDPGEGMELLKQAALSDALAVIGPSCSSVAEPLYEALQHRVGDTADHGFKVPIFTDGATKADLARISEWAFRNSPDERDMYPELWRWVKANKPELKTVFAGEEADFVHSHSTLQNIIVKDATDSEFTLLGRTQWSIHDTGFAESAAAIKAANPDIVVVFAHALTTCGVLKELARQHFKPKLIVGLTSASTTETLRLCGPEAEGLLIPTSFIANTTKRLEERHDVENEGGIADLHSMAAWEILFTLKQAIESARIVPNKEPIQEERDRLRLALSKLKTIDGVMGTIIRTPDRESLKPFVLVQATSGSWKVVSTVIRASLHAQELEEDLRIPYGNSGLRLFLRHLPPSSLNTEKHSPVLFIHGATFPSALAAAFPFDGHSWMQDLSEHGFDVWALDFMGYGGSDRYPQMMQPPGSNTTPLLQTPEAAEQITTASDFIRKHTGMAKVSIIAHSWGTLPTGVYAMNHGDDLDRIVFFGPIAPRNGQVPDRMNWQSTWDVTVDAQMKRFRGYLPTGQVPVLDEPDMQVWGETYLASDPSSGNRTPPSVRVPYGPGADIDLAWSGTFPYDPKRIAVPVLIVRGEWDVVTQNKDAEWIFSRLIHAPVRRDVRISRGTHVMHLEESRFQLYQESEAFLQGKANE